MIKYLMVLYMCFSSIVSAQLEGENAPRFKFKCVVFEHISEEQVYFRENEIFHPIYFKKGKRSIEYSYKANHGLELFLQKVNEEGEKYYYMIGKSKFNPERLETLYLVDKVAGQKFPLRIIGMDDSIENFPRSNFKFINLTQDSVGVMFNKSKKVLKSGQAQCMKADVPAKGGVNPVIIVNRKGETLRSTQMFVQPLGRKVIFLYPPAYERERLKLRYLPEVLPKPKPQPE